ncbi:hypothetical protein SLEP1_g40016 [Rubroshorea leprosula]|uniref:Uncharacterized protein n=1 Tax=Rubroshorea leprosula TaxID=152421 RepID=A0AAV5L2Z6_9ROSI|nr:hypothetical protein SLEP1_g40016 [Rubroshorea leprosula]
MKLEEMRLATREINQWKPFKKLSPKLKEEVHEYQRRITSLQSSSNEIACLQSGDFCGKELVEWVQDPNPRHLPVSSRSIQALTKVEAFALQARDMKRNWDAIHIQAAARILSALRKRRRKKQLNSQSVNAKAVKNLSRSSGSPSNGSKYSNESSTSQPDASRFQARSPALLEAQSVIEEQ